MDFILPLLYIILFTESLCLILKTRFEKGLPLTFILSGISLFISQILFNTFIIGFVICVLFSFYFIYTIIKNKKKIVIKDYITPGLIGFLIIYLLVYIYDFNRFFTNWDELSHWGKMVKEMIKLDDFYSSNLSNLIAHKDYPPMVSLVELFFTFLSTKYKEAYLIRCVHLFELSILLSFIKFDKESLKNSIFKVLVVSIITYFITFLFDSAIVINSIYTDYLLSLIAAYILFNIYKTNRIDRFSYVNLIFSTTFLLLVKQVSIAYYLMVLFLFIVMIIYKKYDSSIRNKIISLLSIIIIPLSFLFIWNYNIKDIDVDKQFKLSDIKISSVKEIASSNTEENYQKETILNYANALLEKNVLNSNIKVCFVTFGFILLILFILVNIKLKDRYLYPLEITLFIGYFGYIIMMLLLYVFSFGPNEGPNLASFDRYMCSYLLVCVYTLIFIFISNRNILIANYRIYLIVLFITMLLIKPISLLKLRPDFIILKNHRYDSYERAAKLIDRNVSDMDKVYIIDQEEKHGAYFFINYFSDKIKTNTLNYELSLTSNNSKDLFYSDYYYYMVNFNYLYTYSINDKFINEYSFLSEYPIEDDTLYKIDKDEGIIKLMKIESLK